MGWSEKVADSYADDYESKALASRNCCSEIMRTSPLCPFSEAVLESLGSYIGGERLALCA